MSRDGHTCGGLNCSSSTDVVKIRVRIGPNSPPKWGYRCMPCYKIINSDQWEVLKVSQICLGCEMMAKQSVATTDVDGITTDLGPRCEECCAKLLKTISNQWGSSKIKLTFIGH